MGKQPENVRPTDLLEILETAAARIKNTEPLVSGDVQKAICHKLAQEVTEARTIVADLVNALDWALRRIRDDLDTGDLYANAEAVLIRADAYRLD